MNSIFTEENLLTYTTAAKFASFSKAAEELGITTSAVSYTIKRIETYLDVALFIRDTRNIELTEAGYYFYRKATDLLNNFHLIKKIIKKKITANFKKTVWYLPNYSHHRSL